jgi:hypothetical protein
MLPYEKHPSSGHTDAQPPSKENAYTGGVGDLPGKRSEHCVALLPEERLHPAGTSARCPPSLHVLTHPPDAILMSHLPPRMDQMPTMEHLSGSVVGVGSLPGRRHEFAVALTPEERLHPPGTFSQARPMTPLT